MERKKKKKTGGWLTGRTASSFWPTSEVSMQVAVLSGGEETTDFIHSEFTQNHQFKGLQKNLLVVMSLAPKPSHSNLKYSHLYTFSVAHFPPIILRSKSALCKIAADKTVIPGNLVDALMTFNRCWNVSKLLSYLIHPSINLSPNFSFTCINKTLIRN